MFPSSLFEVEYARMRDVQDLAETGEYGDNVGPARKLARLSDLVGLGGGGSTFSKTEADGLYAPKTGSTEYATQFDVALGLAAKAEVGHTHSGLYQPWGDYLVAADIAGKADTTTTYTKTQVDTALATKSDTTHTHTGVYQPVGTYLTSADLTAALVNYALKTEVSTKADVTYVDTQLATKANKTELAPYALQSQLNALIGEVSDKADVAVLQGYVQKTELPVVPDDGYATNTQLTLGLASKANQTEVSNLSTLLNNIIERVDLNDDREWNTVLQPDDSLFFTTTLIAIENGTQRCPKWTLGGLNGSNEFYGWFRVDPPGGASPEPYTPSATRGVFFLRTFSSTAPTNPVFTEQQRNVTPGSSYSFRVLLCRRETTGTSQVKLSSRDVADQSPIGETTVTQFGSMAAFDFRYAILTFTAPDSGSVMLRIANHGTGTATANLIYIAEAYLVRND